MFIGRGITVTILDVSDDGTVRVGIEAPRSIAVSRDDYPYESHLEFQERRENEHKPHGRES